MDWEVVWKASELPAQSVVISSVKSSWRPVISAVPRGSITGAVSVQNRKLWNVFCHLMAADNCIYIRKVVERSQKLIWCLKGQLNYLRIWQYELFQVKVTRVAGGRKLGEEGSLKLTVNSWKNRINWCQPAVRAADKEEAVELTLDTSSCHCLAWNLPCCWQ